MNLARWVLQKLQNGQSVEVSSFTKESAEDTKKKAEKLNYGAEIVPPSRKKKNQSSLGRFFTVKIFPKEKKEN